MTVEEKAEAYDKLVDAIKRQLALQYKANEHETQVLRGKEKLTDDVRHNIYGSNSARRWFILALAELIDEAEVCDD